MGDKMKEYLNSQEEFTIMKLGRQLSDMEHELIEEWGKRGNLTKDERKNLRTSLTFGLKAFESILVRQNRETKIKFAAHADKVYIRTVDRYAEEKLERILNQKINTAREIESKVCDFLEVAFDLNCKGCTKNGTDCELYKMCMKHDIEEMDDTHFDGKKCKYAYKI